VQEALDAGEAQFMAAVREGGDGALAVGGDQVGDVALIAAVMQALRTLRAQFGGTQGWCGPRCSKVAGQQPRALLRARRGSRRFPKSSRQQFVLSASKWQVPPLLGALLEPWPARAGTGEAEWCTAALCPVAGAALLCCALRACAHCPL
jgi:hypothetical protein